MSYLVDTNVLLRSVQPKHPMHKDAVTAALKLKQSGESLCIIPQNLIEFWAVATRPVTANGLELSVASAAQELTTTLTGTITRRTGTVRYMCCSGILTSVQVRDATYELLLFGSVIHMPRST